LPDIYYLTKRNLIASVRIPIMPVFTIVQPLSLAHPICTNHPRTWPTDGKRARWQLFRHQQLPDSFVPAIIMQTVLFSGAWSGNPLLLVTDMDMGVLTR